MFVNLPRLFFRTLNQQKKKHLYQTLTTSFTFTVLILCFVTNQKALINLVSDQFILTLICHTGIYFRQDDQLSR